MDCKNKFNNFKNSAFALRRLNDKLCREHGLSVIENPKRRARPRGEVGAVKYGNSYKEKLRKAIDHILPESVSWDDFLARMRAEGYEIKTGKYLAFRAPCQERFTRAARLGEVYEKDALRRRVGKQKPEPARSSKKTQRTAGRKINLLIDIQAKLEAGKGKGYERWAKIFNLKEAARTLNFLTENGITEYEELAERTAEAEKKYDAAALRMKQLEGRMAEAAQLKMHIINYSKTREISQQYRKAVNKTRFWAKHKEVSAREMSLSLGQSTGYINKIEIGENNASMQVFFNICEYLEVTPKEFFDTDVDVLPRLKEYIGLGRRLSKREIEKVNELIKEFKRWNK